MNANNINKQQKLVVREEKILKWKQNKHGTFLEISRMRIMHAPVSRIFDGWSPCCKMWNEVYEE
jgi:intein-encoded DNA endonuclease-like protein